MQFENCKFENCRFENCSRNELMIFLFQCCRNEQAFIVILKKIQYKMAKLTIRKIIEMYM